MLSSRMEFYRQIANHKVIGPSNRAKILTGALKECSNFVSRRQLWANYIASHPKPTHGKPQGAQLPGHLPLTLTSHMDHPTMQPAVCS